MNYSFIECHGEMEESRERPGILVTFRRPDQDQVTVLTRQLDWIKGETGRDAIGASDEIKSRESPGQESRVNGVDEIMLKVNV